MENSHPSCVCKFYLGRLSPDINCNYFFLPLYSSETVSFARPFARRAANTRRPFFVAILSRKPCLFFLFLLEGWNVLFIVLYIICFCSKKCFMLFSVQNYSFFLYWQSFMKVIFKASLIFFAKTTYSRRKRIIAPISFSRLDSSETASNGKAAERTR